MKAKNNPSILVYMALAALVAVGLGAGIVRLINGMGATTALTDSYPWGLWIIYDVFFVPFSAGAFMILAIAHIYNRHEYHAIARPVVLAGILGELMVVAVLVMDLGRWFQFYNVLFPWYWNIRSFMFQVSICLTIYMGVMALEIAPAILERLNWQKLLRYIRPLTVLIAGAGIVLSSLHQSSLGSLFLLMPYKLNALWWTPLLPLLFFTSAVFSGLSMAILVVILSFRIFHRKLELKLVSDLARVASVILGLYLVLKIGDLIINGELGLLFSSGSIGLLFLVEIVVGVIVPLILFGMRRFRSSANGLMWGAASALVGILLNRTIIALWAQTVPGGATYRPSWMEIAISVAAIAAGVLLFGLAVHLLPILPEDSSSEKSKPVGWSRRSTVPVAAVVVVLTPLVVIGLQPVIHSHMAQAEQITTPAIQSIQELEDCRDCHENPAALTEAGAQPQDLQRLYIEPPDSSSPHANLDCVTCHHGNGSAGDLESIHTEVIVDPSQGDSGTCLACHRDLPAEIPQDRLRTPHDQLSHGQASDVYCSDCHGAVGHGFDPVSGNVICPMTVCIDCHISRGLGSTLTDCSACHITPHDPVPPMQCSDCHQSTDAWQGVAADTHPVELIGQHASASCLACHQESTPTYECTNCHQPPENHPAGDCSTCHTPEGWIASALAHSQPGLVTHTLEGRENCLVCHDPLGQALPAPANHVGYTNDQCLACHGESGGSNIQAPVVGHSLNLHEHCSLCHDPAGQIKPAPPNHNGYTDDQCLICHQTE